MLIQISVKNFKTFKEKATLSMVASNYDTDTREEENVIFHEKYNFRLLKSAVVYGANASGKSKLFEAFVFMKNFVIHSSTDSQEEDRIQVDPFRLSKEAEHEPSEFEVIFIQNDIQYRYGFEATQESVISEWLYYKPKTKEIELFYRENQNIEPHPRDFKRGRMVIKEGLVRANALVLSVAAQFNDEIAKEVLQWFRRFRTISGLHESGFRGFTMHRSNDKVFKEKMLELIRAADMGIRDFEPQILDPEDLPAELPPAVREAIKKDLIEKDAKVFSDVLTTHKKYDRSGMAVGETFFSLDEDESSGTKKFFALTGPILDVLENGYILSVDELDSKLHPNLVCRIVALFNSEKFNKRNAQLLFNTHDTNLLDSGLFRRDQIWFTKKDRYEAATLYSLADFKSDQVRKNEPYEENYLQGKYGAVPYLHYFDWLDPLSIEYEKEEQEA